jgi:hypothetical protein
MSNTKYLDGLSKDQLINLAILSLKSGNFITLRDIDSKDKKVITKETLEKSDKNIFFEVC